ncbi:hypothetical protein GCM10023200_48670 [Actinomycetospora chlora]|uniref:DUF6542 domain-containing protein n=1 Tax=Actinomycetospora chlora TaxID=663608 RepID=A0ABP9C700_9PSEU
MFAVGPGFSWPVVGVVAVVATGLLARLLEDRAGLLGVAFPLAYLAVCLLAVAMVRPRSAAVAGLAPAVTAALGIVLAAVLAGRTASSTLFLLTVLAPLARLFWWMLAATAACLLLALARRRRRSPRGAR